jgi:hypothetical protein
MRRACRLLATALLVAFASSAQAAPPSKKHRTKPASFGQLATFYTTTPSGYNDDITDTDVMVMSLPGYGTAMATVSAETRPQAYKASRMEMEKRFARIGLKLAVDKDFKKLPSGQIHALAEEVQAQGIPQGSGEIFLCSTPEALTNLCNRATWLGDRDTGKATQVVLQLFVLAWVNNVSFGPGEVATTEIKCVPIPYALLGTYQKDHRNTRQLAGYLASIAAGEPLKK